jgi:hypothetical protein
VHSHLSAAESSHHRNITREELLRPLSVFPFVEDVSFSKSRPGSGGKRQSGKASETGEVTMFGGFHSVGLWLLPLQVCDDCWVWQNPLPTGYTVAHCCYDCVLVTL